MHYPLPGTPRVLARLMTLHFPHHFIPGKPVTSSTHSLLIPVNYRLASASLIKHLTIFLCFPSLFYFFVQLIEGLSSETCLGFPVSFKQGRKKALIHYWWHKYYRRRTNNPEIANHSSGNSRRFSQRPDWQSGVNKVVKDTMPLTNKILLLMRTKR